MALTQHVLDKINNPKDRVAIAGAMGVTEMAVINYIKRNDVKLTQYSPLQVIKKIMEVEDESTLLVGDKTTA